MSIRDFYMKLVSGNEENSFLASLRRLSLVEDVSHFSGGGTGDPAGDWVIWNQQVTECPSGA
ncbi:MAG TPA: hypothetical protein VFE33_13670 [Thermoanaerobaculia bacterium]|nr:hypothetical protein [Thermoanaerobaculia bacterium]